MFCYNSSESIVDTFMNANMLSKHISRLFCLNSTTRRVDSVPKWCLPPKRYLHQDPKADPNPIVASGETGTKFSFKTKFALWSLAGLGTLGYVFYVKNKKDMSKSIRLKANQNSGTYSCSLCSSIETSASGFSEKHHRRCVGAGGL